MTTKPGPLRLTAQIIRNMSVQSLVNICEPEPGVFKPAFPCKDFYRDKFQQLYSETKLIPLSWKQNLLGMGVYGFGKNDDGQLGLGTDERKYSIPQRITDTSFQLNEETVKITQVSAGDDHTVCLDENGDVWTFGWNDEGQLGLGDTSDEEPIPQQIPDLSRIVQVSAGRDHTVCLDENGNVWSFGDNLSGQLGLGGISIEEPIPQQILDLPNIIQVSAGAQHTVCIDDEMNVWSFGRNSEGQLGLGDTSIEEPIPQQILTLSNITQVSAGAQHTVCLDDEMNVWSFGENSRGLLGLGPNFEGVHTVHTVHTPQQIPGLSNITQVSAGDFHTVCIDDKKNVWGFGVNDDYQLGLRPEGVHTVHTVHTPQQIPGLSNITQVSAGDFHTVCIDEDRNVWTFGLNDVGQLGLGTDQRQYSTPQLIENTKAVKVSAGGSHTILIGI